MSRITVTLMQEFDKIPNDVIVLAATNRYDLLDSAFVSRFSTKQEMKPFTTEENQKMIQMFLSDIGYEFDETEINRIVKNASDMGMSAIFFQVRPAADALYRSEIFPVSSVLGGELPYGFDPLAELCAAAHRRGISVVAWVNPLRVTLKAFQTREQALAHPNWSMGAKITIDSATMMNKGLELIEAMWLYDLPPEDIEIVVHRESIVHSAVEFADGAVIAQLGLPDMRLPIQLALTWPQRVPCKVPRMSLAEVAKLTFYAPDYEAFPALNLAKHAASLKGDRGAVLNGANEAVVGLFLNGKIGFTDIAERVAYALDTIPYKKDITLDDVLAADKAAREIVLG